MRYRLLLFQLNDALPATALALNGLGDLAMPQSRRGPMLIPQRTVVRVKSLLGIRQIQLHALEQPPCSLDFVLVFPERFIEPSPGIFAVGRTECADDLIQFARLEFLNLVFAIDDDGERRCLYASQRGDSAAASPAESQRKCARGVDAYQPIRLVAAARRAGQRLHLSVAAQSRESVADSLWRHRLQPKTIDCFFRAGVLDDVAEDQFALAAGVAGIDDLGDVLVSYELSQHADATAHFFRWLKFKLRRHDGELFHVPFVLFFHGSGYRELKELTHGPRDQVSVVLVVILAFFEAAERLGDIARD